MSKYVCSVCGYVYDESKEAIKFDSLPDTWKCPLCGASKQDFQKQEEQELTSKKYNSQIDFPDSKVSAFKNVDKQLSNVELSILCSNLSKGCEKQYMQEEASLFAEIAEYYKKHSENSTLNDFESIGKLLNEDLTNNFPLAFNEAKLDSDRGALRALTWSEKVSKIVNGIIERYKSEGVKFLENTKIFVCEICGFIYIGDQAPEVCPVCKVPKLKIHEVGRI